MFDKMKEKSFDFMKTHPKFMKLAVSGSTALVTLGSTAVVASAEGETSSAADPLDTVVETMQSSLTSTVLKVIPAVIGIGLIVLGFNFAWKYFKKMTK